MTNKTNETNKTNKSNLKKVLLGLILGLLLLGVVYFLLGSGVLIFNKEAKRIKEIEKEFKIDFRNIPELQEESQLQLQTERLEEYKELALSDKAEDQLKGWLGLGGLRKMIKDYRGAEEAWLVAGEIYPETMLGFCNLAGLYNFFLNEETGARENYERCLQNNPLEVQYYLDYADLLKKKGEIDKAERILGRAFEKNGNEPNLLIFAAYFYKEVNNKEKAIEYFLKAIEVLPERERYYEEEIDKLNLVN